RPAHVEQQIDDDQSVDRATDETQLSAKVAPQAHDDTSHAGTSGSDKQPIAQTRGDLPSRGDPIVPDAPVSVSADAGATVMNASDNAVQPTVTAAPPHTTPAAPTAPAFVMPPGLQAAAIPISGVPLEIAGKALAGKNRFEIRLDPPELGRIEVRLDVDHDGNVTSRLTVDRAETLELLRRDASGLERALQDAGLKTSDNGLQFALRDQYMNQKQRNIG